MVEKITIMSWTYNLETFKRTEHYFTSKQKAIKYYKNKVAKNEPVCLYILNHLILGMRSWSSFRDKDDKEYCYGDWKAFYNYYRVHKK